MTTCQTSDVPVTVVDILLIARSLVLEPWHFTRLVSGSATCRPGPFALDDSGDLHRLVIGPVCPFLLHTNDGGAFCGLIGVRPVCQRPLEESDLTIHAEVARGWNAYAQRWPAGSGLDLTDLTRYALDVTSVLLDRS